MTVHCYTDFPNAVFRLFVCLWVFLCHFDENLSRTFIQFNNFLMTLLFNFFSPRHAPTHVRCVSHLVMLLHFTHSSPCSRCKPKMVNTEHARYHASMLTAVAQVHCCYSQQPRLSPPHTPPLYTTPQTNCVIRRNTVTTARCVMLSVLP